MADVLVRNLDRRTLNRLKERAKRNRRSLQSEAKSVLERAAGDERVADLLAKWQNRMKGRRVSSSASLIREDRGR